MAETRGKIKIKLTRMFPDGFDARNPDDMMRLTRSIQEKAAKNPDKYGGYLIDSISEDGQYAIIAPMATADTAMLKLAGEGLVRGEEIDVADSMGEARQKATVERIELAYASSTDPAIKHEPGKTWKVIEFRPTSTKCSVFLQFMDERTISVRKQFADALGVARYPWLIRLTPTVEGGWKIRILDPTLTYRPSRHDSKLQETVEAIGAPGWFFKGDAENGVITVYPGVLPTFPAKITPPEQFWKGTDLRHSYFGMKLPERGRETGDLLYNDWKDAPGVLVAGATNGGKSVVINNLIYSALSAGCDLYICDDEGKNGDFIWCRDWVAYHGWGADSPESAAATLQHVIDLYFERMKTIKAYGKMNYWGLPAGILDPILFVADEIAQWAAPISLSGLSKDSPTYPSTKYESIIHTMNYTNLRKLSQKARSAGIFFIYAAQSATQPNGLDPNVRTNLGTKILVGDKVEDTVRITTLKDPKHAPTVPENVIRQKVSMGTGVAEPVGQEACVYKSFFVEDKSREHGEFSDILRENLLKVRPPKGNSQSGAWTWQEIEKIVPFTAEKPPERGVETLDEVEDIEPVKIKDASGNVVDATDIAAAIGM